MQRIARHDNDNRGFEAELKLVTSLFVDLVGSLETISVVGPQHASNYFEHYREQLIEIAHHHGGTVGTVAGDGVLFLFGAPTANSKHASNACLAALEMMSAAENQNESDPQMELRIGMSTGEILVKPVEIDIGWHYDATGVSVHVASRLQSMAESGTIIMEQMTHDLAGDGFLIEELGPHDIRGLKQPLQLYELRGIKINTSVVRKSGPARFLGRQNEIQQLMEICSASARDSARVVLIVGDPGIGKSRLISEVNAEIEKSNSQQALFCRGFYGLFEPFSAVRECVRQLVAEPDQISREMFLDGIMQFRTDRQPEEMLSATIGNLHTELFGGTEPEGVRPAKNLDSSIGKKLNTILQGFRSLLDITQSEGGAVFLIDEFLELDGESKEIFFHLMSPQAEFPGTFILSCRSERVAELLKRDLANIEVIKIAGLSDDASVALATELNEGGQAETGSDSQTMSFPELARRSGGNPLFLQEMMTAHLRNARDATSRPAAETATLSMAQTPVLQTVIAERIDRFLPKQRQVLKVASILGEEFPVAILAKVLSRLELEWSSVETLVEGQILTFAREPECTYLRFIHPLFREVSANSIVEHDETKFHTAAFEAMEPGLGLGDQALALARAHHAKCARLWAQASEAFRLAGVLSNERAMNTQAIEMFNEALAASKHLTDPGQRADVRVNLMLEMRNPLFQIGDLGGVANSLNEAKKALAEGGDPRQRGKILSFESHVSWLRGQPSAAQEAGRKVSDIAQAIGDPAMNVRANFHQGLASAAFGHDDKAVGFLGRSVRAISDGVHSDYLGVNLSLMVLAQSYKARSLMYCGRVAESVQAVQSALDAAEKSDDIFAHIIARISAGIVFLPADRPGECQAAFKSALSLLDSVEARLMRPVFEANYGLMHLCMGDTASGRALIERSIKESTKIDLNFELGKKYLYLSFCHLVSGDTELALAALDTGARASIDSEETKVADIAEYLSKRIRERPPAGRDAVAELFDASLKTYPAIMALSRSL